MRKPAGDVLLIEENCSGIRTVVARQQVEQGTLACAVWADNRIQVPLGQDEIQVSGRMKTSETLVQAGHFQDFSLHFIAPSVIDSGASDLLKP